MSSSVIHTADTILSTGLLVAIIIPSVIVGLAILICIICLIYCTCCKKSKSYPGAVINQQPYPATGYTNPPPYPATNYNNQQPYPATGYTNPPPYPATNYNNQPTNKV